MDGGKFLELCRTGSIAELRRVIEQGFDILDAFADEPDDQLPIMNAADGETVRFLLEQGASLWASGDVPLVILAIRKVAANEAPLSMLAAIAEADDSLNSNWDPGGREEDLDGPYWDGGYAIHVAVRTGRTDIVAAVLEAGGDLALASNDGETPIGIAASSGNTECVQLLLDAGTPLRADDFYFGIEFDDEDDRPEIAEPADVAKHPEIARTLARALKDEVEGARVSVTSARQQEIKSIVDILNNDADSGDPD